MQKSSRKQRTMELVRISSPPRQLQGDSRNIPELLPDRSEKAPGQLPEIFKKGPPAAPKRLPKSCRPASRAIRQNSWAILGQPRFPLFCNTFSIFFDTFHNGQCPDFLEKLRTCPIASRELLPGFLQQQLLYSSLFGGLREPSVIEKLINCTENYSKTNDFFSALYRRVARMYVQRGCIN